MNLLKTLFCLLLFIGALGAALWPIFVNGKVDWLYDMDIDGGVQIAYKADFSSLPAADSTPAQRRSIMARSHERLDARVAQFQGADVRVQILGEDQLLVEVPGVHNIAEVRAELGKPQVVSFARVISVSSEKDPAHQQEVDLPNGKALWVELDGTVALGGDILYDEMTVSAGTDDKTGEPEYGVSMPLDDAGADKFEKLTIDAFNRPAKWSSTDSDPEPEIVLLLDQQPQELYRVVDKGIRQCRLTSKTLEGAEVTRRLLSAGPMPIGFNVVSERHISPLVGQRLRGRALLALPISLLVLFVLIGLAYSGRPCFVKLLLFGMGFNILGFIFASHVSGSGRRIGGTTSAKSHRVCGETGQNRLFSLSLFPVGNMPDGAGHGPLVQNGNSFVYCVRRRRIGRGHLPCGHTGRDCAVSPR
jgi:hypothetical protein